MIRIDNINLPPDYTTEDIKKHIDKLLKHNEYTDLKIVRRSVDARKKDNVHYNVSAEVKLKGNEEKLVRFVNNKNVTLTKPKKYIFPYQFSEQYSKQFSEQLFDDSTEQEIEKKSETTLSESKIYRPVIIGAGPAGYFAATVLAENGFRPVLFERGRAVEERKKDVETFWETGKLSPESNVSFGEGGAGTFSDGKLNTGNKDKDGIFKYINETFYRFGADESVTYDSKPHIGTDRLTTIMKNMRENIIKNGGEIHFESCLKDIEKCDDYYVLKLDVLKDPEDLELDAVKADIKHREIIKIKAREVILSIGHSARDTFKMLYEKGFLMEQKPFAIGLRIEHPRDMINAAQYGPKYKDLFPTADYKLTYHASNERAVFSFCMCPGGYVVNASSEEGCMTVNGMSESKRDAANSNSALVVNILPEDIPGDDPLDAVEFQRSLEKRFYEAGKGCIPLQRFEDFEKGVKTVQIGAFSPCIKGKFVLSELKSCLPEYAADAIIEGIRYFSSKIEDFDNGDALLSGIESRTSSPVRIIRDEKLEAPEHPGIYPCGEGAGYAGGITSAAADGIRCAEKLAEKILERCRS